MYTLEFFFRKSGKWSNWYYYVVEDQMRELQKPVLLLKMLCDIRRYISDFPTNLPQVYYLLLVTRVPHSRGENFVFNSGNKVAWIFKGVS